MDFDLKAKYEKKSRDLRAELKTWETEWADSHGGGKPGREDIKSNQDIARKYKQYNQVRDIIAGKLPPSDEHFRSKKRKSDVEHVPAETPVKRSKHTETPSGPRHYDGELMNSPAISRKLFSPAPVTSLGPTPQRDGRVLGLFDLLVERELGTPSKKDPKSSATDTRAPVHATPSKRRRDSADDGTERLGRTPMSTSKRQYLNEFMTPLKKRDGNIGARQTPTSSSKRQFDTPAFLRRHTLPALDADEHLATHVSPLRLPRKPLGRGLSEIVAGLRKVEEEQLDDDLDALRDVEYEDVGGPPPVLPSAGPKDASVPSHSEPQPQTQPQTQPDDQTRMPLGGFDDEGLYDSPVEDQVGRDGMALPVYKKKGQKRTTRRVNMRPTRAKRPTDMANAGEHDGSGDEYAHDESGSDFDDAAGLQKPVAVKKTPAAAKTEGTVKKAARKVNELAHANFQRLKLRNHGAKGGPGFNSKFRRRR